MQKSEFKEISAWQCTCQGHRLKRLEGLTERFRPYHQEARRSKALRFSNTVKLFAYHRILMQKGE